MSIHYQISGEGPVLVLVHGMGVTFTIWQQLAPLLSPYYKLVQVELPGNGASAPLPQGQDYYQGSAAALEELRLELGLDRWNLLGYSLGGWVVQTYLQRWPQHVEQAIFLCPAITKPFWANNLNNLRKIDSRWPAVGNWLLSGWRLRELVRWFGFSGQQHPYIAVWAREISAQPVQTIKAGLYDLPQAGRAAFPLPQRPVHFIWADHDAITATPQPLRPLDSLVPGVHGAPMLSAEAVAEVVRGILKA